jgi:hypothetical protein
MSFLHWFTSNWADTDEAGTTIRPIDSPVSPREAVALLESASRALPLWWIESLDAAAGTFHASGRARLWRFTDDISIRLEAVAGRTRVHARSQAASASPMPGKIAAICSNCSASSPVRNKGMRLPQCGDRRAFLLVQ